MNSLTFDHSEVKITKCNISSHVSDLRVHFLPSTKSFRHKLLYDRKTLLNTEVDNNCIFGSENCCNFQVDIDSEFDQLNWSNSESI